MQNKPISPITWVILLIAVILGGIWFSLHNTAATLDTQALQSASSATSTPSAAPASNQPLTIETYWNPQHQFGFQYPSDWKISDVFNVGPYQGYPVLVRGSEEADIRARLAQDPQNLDLIDHEAENNVIFFRILKNSSINSIIANLYNNQVTVSDARIGGKDIAHVIHSRGTDPVNWKQGSTESYIFRNTLGEAVVVEARYATPEPQNDGDLHALLQKVVQSFILKAL